MRVPVAVVTDSTATLDPTVAAAHAVAVVPLHVVVGGAAYEEGMAEASPDVIAAALREHVSVSTSRPPPETFVRAYDDLLAAGHESCVSVHLSAEVSGTVESARLAAAETSLDVTVLDTRLVGIGTGLAALAAARAAQGGAGAAMVVAAAQTQAAATTSLIYVDTLEHLRRGGRVGNVAALMGTALAVKPLLTLVDGQLVQREKVRTAARALARIEELVVQAARDLGEGPRTVVVQHLAAPERAHELAERLHARLGRRGADLRVRQAGDASPPGRGDASGMVGSGSAGSGSDETRGPVDGKRHGSVDGETLGSVAGEPFGTGGDAQPGAVVVEVGEVGAVIGAHVGPGMVAVVIAPGLP